MIDTSLFPYENHPYRLEFGDKKEKTICFFSCEEHLQKYLNRYKLDKKTIKIDYRDGESIQLSKRNKRSVEQTPKPKSNRGTGAVRKGKSSVDSTRNTTRNPKRKK
jgi:hypothetical protein